tara:strand:+ start:1334 stop:1543 length:210 start_codon:yes stop_codon:yes gene_type:complete
LRKDIYFFNAKQKETISSIVLEQKTVKIGEIEYFLYFEIGRRAFWAAENYMEMRKWSFGGRKVDFGGIT